MMNAVVKPYHEMCLNSSELIVPRDTYQRALHPARVARIAKEFDERVANEPKISFRDGHYYVMDGQNTIAARKFLNGGEDLQIRCKVYFGMTEREEALLFAQQTGISERLSAGQKLRALIFAGEPAAVAFQQATELAGVHLSFEEGRGKQRISCIATAYHEFIRLGPELYIESLDVLLNAWNGEPDSMSSANLLGICRFVELYHSEYSKSRLIAKLRQVDALKTFVHHTSYGCMVWFTNAKQANIRRETYTSQLMKGGHFTMNLPLFISSANFLLMKSLLLVLFRGLCSLLRLTAQQKIN